MEPIVEDMAEIGVDIWQGVLNTNNIPAISEKVGDGMLLMGGVEFSFSHRPGRRHRRGDTKGNPPGLRGLWKSERILAWNYIWRPWNYLSSCRTYCN